MATIDQVFAILTDPFYGNEAIATRQTKVQPAPAIPAVPTVDPGIAAFKAERARLSLIDFKAKYGVDFGAPLPPLPIPLDPERVKEYAWQGYTWQGQSRGGPVPMVQGEDQAAICAQVIDDNANGRATYYTGNGLGDVDVCTVGFLSGLWASFGYQHAFMGGGASPAPYCHPGDRWDFPRFCASLPGGSPGVPS